MGYNNGSIFAPVSIHDVQQVLGSGSTDLGTLCRLANINKWARYKPYNYNAIGAAFRPSASDTISKLAGIMFGLTVPQHASLSDMNVAVVNEQSYWSYTGKPVGGQQSPYRLTDFEGYQHDLSAWGGFNNKWDLAMGGSITFETVPSDGTTVASGDRVSFSLESDYDGELGFGNLIRITDFFGRISGFDTDFKNFYGGILFWDTTRVYPVYYIDTKPLYNSTAPDDYGKYRGVQILTNIPTTLQSSPFRTGTYRVIPFLIQPWDGISSFIGNWTGGALPTISGRPHRILSINGANFQVMISETSARKEVLEHLKFDISSVTVSNNTTTILISYTNNTGQIYNIVTNESIPEIYIMAQSENSYDNSYVGADWDGGWTFNTDPRKNVAPNGVLYATQIRNNTCIDRPNTNTLYGRTARLTKMDGTALTQVPTGTGTLGKAVINGTSDSYGNFDQSNSFWFCVEFNDTVLHRTVLAL